MNKYRIVLYCGPTVVPAVAERLSTREPFSGTAHCYFNFESVNADHHKVESEVLDMLVDSGFDRASFNHRDVRVMEVSR